MKQLTELLHLLLCSLDHEYQIEETLARKDNPKCFYYVDCQLGSEEGAADLITWTKVSENFLQDLEFKNPEEALKFLKRVLMVLQGLNPAINGVGKRREFIKLLIGD